MFHAVAGPVAVAHAGDAQTAACQAVVCERADPHELGSRIVALGFVHHDAGRIDGCADEAAGDVIGRAHRGLSGEKALHDVGDHVGHPRRRLIRREGEGEFGVEEGDLGTDELAVATALEPLGVIADDAGVGGFGAGGRDGHHGRDRQAVPDGCLLGPEVPSIAGIARGDCDPLGAVHRRAAADWQDYVDLLALGERRALAHEGDLGIGAHAAQFDMGHAGGVE